MRRTAFGVLVLAAAAVTVASGQGAGKASTPPSTQSPAASGTRIYVSDERGTEVVIVDPDAGGIVERINVGKRPRGMKISQDGKQLFVALSGSPIGGPGVDEKSLPPADRSADGVGVVDLATRKLIRNLKSGNDPETFDMSPDGKTLYVSNEDAGEMSIVDVASGTVTSRVKVGDEPEGVTVRPGGREVYVTSEAGHAVFVVNPSTRAIVAKIAVSGDGRPRAIVFTKDGATAFVSDEIGGAVDVIDAATHARSTSIKIPAGPPPATPLPMGLALSADEKQLYVSLGRAGAIGVIDVPGRRVSRTITGVGVRPWGLALSPDGRKLYTANGPGGDVSVVDIASGKVDRKIATGGSPWGVVVRR